MSYWTNLWNSIIGKAYQNEISKPLDVNRGANWQSAHGVRPTYSQGTALDAYGVHAYTHAAVSRISADLAALRLKLMSGKGVDRKEIMDHPALDLLNNPNTNMTGYLFRAQLMTDLLLAGNCYILILGQNENNPISILRLHPDEVKILTDEKEGITAYQHTSSGSVVVYPKDRVLHGKNVSYAKGAQQIYGCGATEALAREIDADLNSQKLASDASSKGRPDIILYPKEDGDIWPAETRRQILDNYTKMAKSGGAIALSGQCEIRELKLSPREMEFEASRRMARESISALLGCPPTVLGLPAANFATAKQQNLTYWTNQIKKGKMIAELFSMIARMYDNDLYFEHDYTNVEALQSTRDAQLARIEKHILNGVNPEAAYQYEGLEFPRIEQEREEDIEEDENNIRWMENIIKQYELIDKDVDYGLKSNAKEAMEALSEGTQTALRNKAKNHNEEYKDPAKRVTNVNYLAVSYHRGLAAFNTNPSSVRPGINSSSQWAMARVNGLLYALRNGRFRSGAFDVDLLPAEHPMSNAEKKAYENHYPVLEISTEPSNPNLQSFEDIQKSILGDPANWERYKEAHILSNPERPQSKEGYLLLIARRRDPEDPTNAAPEKGELVIYTDLLARAVDLLNGVEGRLPITEEIREAAYNTLLRYYSGLEKEADPLLPVYLNNFIEKEVTNFPKVGDDKTVSFRNSEYKLFDPEYAKDLKKNYPQIWRAGGNIRGNEQYKKLYPIAERSNRTADTATEIKAMRLREAWAARHFRDGQGFKDPDKPINLSSVGGIVAQIKWLAVGNLGESGMKKVINELKLKMETKSFDDRTWNDWIEKQHSPTERQLERLTRQYLTEAKQRYIERAEAQIIKILAGGVIHKGVLDWGALYAASEEKRLFKQKFQSYWMQTWKRAGDKATRDVFQKANKEQGEYQYSASGGAQDLLDQAAEQVVSTRSKRIGSIVQAGISEGLGTDEIASNISSAGLFQTSAARAIARTEATRIVNRAAIDAYNQVQSAGIKVKKQWLTAGDELVRESHQAMNGQSVEPNAEFENEYGSTFGPGEWGSASEDVNCRCTVVPVIE